MCIWKRKVGTLAPALVPADRANILPLVPTPNKMLRKIIIFLSFFIIIADASYKIEPAIKHLMEITMNSVASVSVSDAAEWNPNNPGAMLANLNTNNGFISCVKDFSSDGPLCGPMRLTFNLNTPHAYTPTILNETAVFAGFELAMFCSLEPQTQESVIATNVGVTDSYGSGSGASSVSPTDVVAPGLIDLQIITAGDPFEKFGNDNLDLKTVFSAGELYAGTTFMFLEDQTTSEKSVLRVHQFSLIMYLAYLCTLTEALRVDNDNVFVTGSHWDEASGDTGGEMTCRFGDSPQSYKYGELTDLQCIDSVQCSGFCKFNCVEQDGVSTTVAVSGDGQTFTTPVILSACDLEMTSKTTVSVLSTNNVITSATSMATSGVSEDVTTTSSTLVGAESSVAATTVAGSASSLSSSSSSSQSSIASSIPILSASELIVADDEIGWLPIVIGAAVACACCLFVLIALLFLRSESRRRRRKIVNPEATLPNSEVMRSMGSARGGTRSYRSAQRSRSTTLSGGGSRGSAHQVAPALKQRGASSRVSAVNTGSKGVANSVGGGNGSGVGNYGRIRIRSRSSTRSGGSGAGHNMMATVAATSQYMHVPTRKETHIYDATFQTPTREQTQPTRAEVHVYDVAPSVSSLTLSPIHEVATESQINYTQLP